MSESKENKSIKISLKHLIFIIMIIVFIIVLLITVIINLMNIKGNTDENTARDLRLIQTQSSIETNAEKKESELIEVVPTLLDEITTNSAWCGTFQLVWNDVKKDLAKQDIIFNKQLAVVDNLNKETFKEKDISSKYYYKTWGKKSIQLKSKIEKGIKRKFNQKSDILDSINWNAKGDEYLFYTLLYKEFNFKNNFNELDSDEFYSNTETYSDINYFGISSDSDSKLYSQVNILYYNSKNDYAVSLETKEDDEIILAVGNNDITFSSIYNSIVEKTNSYTGNIEFGENDFLKVPNLKMNIEKNFSELTTDGSNPDKYFYDYMGNTCYLTDAMQTINLELDKSGGKIKSEAAVGTYTFGVEINREPEKRYFYFDEEFTIFIKEKGKEVPYFAANISNIKLFQE